MTSNRASLLVRVVLCVVSVLCLLTGIFISARWVAAAPSLWEDVLMGYGFALLIALVVALGCSRGAWSGKTESEWVYWVVVGLLGLVTAGSWWSAFSRPVPRWTDFGVSTTIYAGPAGLVLGLHSLRMRIRRALPEGGPEPPTS